MQTQIYPRHTEITTVNSRDKEAFDQECNRLIQAGWTPATDSFRYSTETGYEFTMLFYKYELVEQGVKLLEN